MRVTEAEWEVMESLWRADGVAAGDIIVDVQTRRDWSHRTIRTLLARLVDKEAVSVEVLGSKYLYRAAVSRQQCVKAAARSFRDQFFGGSVKSLLLHFVESESMSAEELQEIQQLLQERQEASKEENRRKPRRD